MQEVQGRGSMQAVHHYTLLPGTGGEAVHGVLYRQALPGGMAVHTGEVCHGIITAIQALNISYQSYITTTVQTIRHD